MVAQLIRGLAVLFLAGVLVGLPVISNKAQARGGGGHGGGGGGLHGGGGYHGGFGGGSFRPEGYHPEGEGRRPGPEPGPGPRPGPHPGPPDPNWHRRYPYNVNNVNVYGGGWGPYWGDGWGAAAAGAAVGAAVAALAIGSAVASMPSSAQRLVVNDQPYYFDGTNYYQPCYQGADLHYCVVPNPNQ